MPTQGKMKQDKDAEVTANLFTGGHSKYFVSTAQPVRLIRGAS